MAACSLKPSRRRAAGSSSGSGERTEDDFNRALCLESKILTVTHGLKGGNAFWLVLGLWLVAEVCI